MWYYTRAMRYTKGDSICCYARAMECPVPFFRIILRFPYDTCSTERAYGATSTHALAARRSYLQ
eukprot:3940311-Rhodomonas_salina.11